MTIWAIIPAAGIGTRMQTDIPKQYLKLGDQTILDISIAKLRSLKVITKIVVMLNPTDEYWPTGKNYHADDVVTGNGGENRYQSVLNGLEYLQPMVDKDDWVLVHDAVRPCVRVDDMQKLLESISGHSIGGLLGAPVSDTLKVSDSQSQVENTLDRSALWSAYTPQIFRYGVLYNALLQAQTAGHVVTDESSAIEALGYKPLLVLGHADNIKITRQEDLAIAAVILTQQTN